MAENKLIDVNELRQWMKGNEPVRGNTVIDDAIEYLIDTTWQLLKVIEAQEARIKALEDRAEIDEDLDNEMWASGDNRS
jgi:hypothetical protein